MSCDCGTLNLSAEVPYSEICIYQGSQWRKTFKLKDKSGAYVNLTGCTIVGVAKLTKGGAVAFNFTVSTDLLTNEFTMTIPYSVTDAITTLTDDPTNAANNFVFDWTITDSVGEQYKINNGKIQITKEV